MHRLFVGLRPPPPIRRLLLAAMGGVPGARWQDEEQLHLTLRFIGEVERPLAEDAAAALGSVRHAAPEIAIHGVGRFDRKGRVSALWAGVRPHDALAQLHLKIDQALMRAGLAPERRAYLPHVTLARFAAATPAEVTDRYLADHAGLASERFACAHFLLFESRLGREAARYEAIERYALG